MIKDIINSPLKTKKYRALMSDGSKIDFGLKSSSTYLDHKDKERRKNYLLRAKGIKNKFGALTYLDKNSPNYWSIKYLW